MLQNYRLTCEYLPCLVVILSTTITCSRKEMWSTTTAAVRITDGRPRNKEKKADSEKYEPICSGICHIYDNFGNSKIVGLVYWLLTEDFLRYSYEPVMSYPGSSLQFYIRLFRYLPWYYRAFYVYVYPSFSYLHSFQQNLVCISRISYVSHSCSYRILRPYI